jgi:LPS-assembly lipoprotein
MGRARAAVIVAATLLAGCGFQPVHQSAGPGADAPVTANVRVQPIPERMGQLVHRELSSRLRSDRPGSGTPYQLAVDLDERIAETGFRADETATRRNVTVTADYRLVDARNGETVLQGRAESTNSANILDQPYATEVAERDARQRGANDLAKKIFRDIASKLAAR